jgi:N-acetylmuramoyl-L-alanine amidase
VTITTDDLNVRSGPGLSYDVVTTLEKGDNFPLIKEDSDWLEILLENGEKGWVANWLVSTSINDSSNVKEDNRESKTTKQGTILVHSLNVRNEPSLQGEVIDRLAEGTIVDITAQTNEWTEINYSGTTGWVNNQYVEIAKKEENEDDSPKETITSGSLGTITATTLNVRSTNSLNADVVGSVSQGDSFVIVEEKDNWVKIEFAKGLYGWIASWFIEVTPEDEKENKKAVKDDTLTILHNGTNIRESANTQSNVIELANEGDTFNIISLQDDWYEIELNNGNSGYIAGWLVSVDGSDSQVKKQGSEQSLEDKTIVIDPGHGGKDNGTTGTRGTLEKKINLATAKKLSDLLEDAGANVILTRSNDTYLSLSSRVKSATRHDADAFISIHYDSIKDRTVKGISTYYYHSFQKDMAKAIQSALVDQTNLEDREARFGDYYVIRENSKVAVLVELGFLSNPTEELLVKTSNYQKTAAFGIYEGLVNYFSEN